MEGSPDKLGVSPRAINELFRVIESVAEDWVYTVTFSTLEIYNETIRDLLDPAADKEKLDVRQTPNGNSVPGLTEVQVQLFAHYWRSALFIFLYLLIRLPVLVK